MEDLKKKVEALLFSSARRMTLEELSKLCRHSPEDIKKVMEVLKKEYEEKKSSLIVVDDGDSYQLTTKDDYLNLVKNIVSKTELTKTLMETLAVIAFKYPVKQADLIKIRTNKAYDHLKELEAMGYITRQKYGRTKLIKLTEKFFDYFSLPQEKLKENFKDFEGLAEAIESKEEEIKKIKEEQRKKAKESKEVDLIDEKGNKVKLDIVDEKPQQEPEEKAKVETYKDNVNGLEVVDVPEEKKEESKEEVEEKPKGIEVTGEMENKVDERVDEILGIKEEVKEEKEEPEEIQEEETTEEEKKKPEEASDVDKAVDAMLNPKEEEKEELHEVDKSKWGQEKEEPKEEKDLLEASFEENQEKENKEKENKEKKEE